MGRTTGRKVLKVVGIGLAVVIAAAAAGAFVYRDNNLHAEERIVDAAFKAGFTEKTATVNGATISYGEGPNNGPALLLVHGQGVEWKDYASVLPELSKQYHVVAVDCFGHGKSDHKPELYTCKTNGDAIIALAKQVFDGDYIVSGHSSGGVLAAYIAANDTEHVTGCMLEDPPLFRVSPEQITEGAGAFAWFDGYTVAHEFLQQSEVTDYPTWYAAHSYLFSLFGGLQDKMAQQTKEFRTQHPDAHVVYEWIPRAWTRGIYYMDEWDPRFGDSFYNGSWLEGIDQEAMLRKIECSTVYLKAMTDYGKDGVLYAANTDEDAARVVECIPHCEKTEIKSGHDIHSDTEHPDAFIEAIGRVARLTQG